MLDRLDAVLADADDLMTEGSAGQLKAHPALAAKADQERLLDQLVRSLNLPLPDEQEAAAPFMARMVREYDER